MSTLPSNIVLGVSGSRFHTTTDAFEQLGLGHDAMRTLMLQLHGKIHHMLAQQTYLKESFRKNSTKSS